MLLLLTFSIFLCVQSFFMPAHINERLDEKMRISKALVGNYPVFDYFRRFILTCYEKLYDKFKKNYSDTAFLLMKKKLPDEIVFDLLPLKIYCHLFYCHRGFDVVNKRSYCTRFYVPHRCLPDVYQMS